MMADLPPTLGRRFSTGHGPALITLRFWGFHVDLATTETVVIESTYSRCT